MHPRHIEALTLANIDYVNLANNHILDYNLEGMLETLDLLDHHHVCHGGAGLNIAQAQQPHYLQCGDTTIGIISGSDHYPAWGASPHGPGIHLVTIDPLGLSHLQPLIHDGKQRADLVILSLHWGPNMRQQPPE